MEIKQKLQQQQVISQRLQQSLSLLAMPITELEAAVELELETNPALERESPAEDDAPPPPPSEGEGGDAGDDINWETYFDYDRRIETPEEGEEETAPAYILNVAGPAEGIKEHLRRQLEVEDLTAADAEIALEIISALDDNGYVRVPLATLAAELEVPEAEVERVLRDVVQRFDPPGVGARDLRECLLLQIDAAGEEAPPLARRITSDYLADVAGPVATLARKLGAAEEEVVEAVVFIRTLEPKPGRVFGGEPNAPLTPDVKVELVGGALRITVLDDRVGRLFISPAYRELLVNAASLDDKTRRYLKARVNAASWFIRALHQRRRTLEDVVRAIFVRQNDFLTQGETGLKTLTMEEVAAEIGIHVSTVSRTVAGKFVDTPRGIYPLKKFFGGGLTGDEGTVAAQKVRVILEDIISAEDPNDPYSDDDLARMLKERGIRVARRTVAKYRAQLRIPSRHERKQRI